MDVAVAACAANVEADGGNAAGGYVADGETDGAVRARVTAARRGAARGAPHGRKSVGGLWEAVPSWRNLAESRSTRGGGGAARGDLGRARPAAGDRRDRRGAGERAGRAGLRSGASGRHVIATCHETCRGAGRAPAPSRWFDREQTSGPRT